MESAREEEKHHATITYSPNQKTNYLASQIINSVVNVVEKNLDNEINSKIVGGLSENIEEGSVSLAYTGTTLEEVSYIISLVSLIAIPTNWS